MKQKSLLKTLLLLCALVVGMSSAWAGEANFAPSDFSDQGTSGTGSAISATVDGVTFACDKGYGAAQIRCYSGGKITISSSETIKAISFTFSGGYNGGLETSYTGLSTTSWEITLTSQARFTAVKVTFGDVPKHSVSFSVNGVIVGTELVEESASIHFPAADDFGGKSVVGWLDAPIVGTLDSAPTSMVTSASMGYSDITYYAVFAAAETTEETNALTINSNTQNIPGSYGTANTFTEYTFEGIKFKVQQMYKNGEKLQWRAAGNSNGTGTMYNTDKLNKIQSIVLTYTSDDSNRNFTIKVGITENPTSETPISPTIDENVYTFDCSSGEYDYFVMTNGSGAGYLSSVEINYIGVTTVATDFCTTVSETAAITSAGYATFHSEYAVDFSGTGVTVYTATDNGATVRLTEVTSGQVPANTPVVLYKEDGATVSVPVIESADAVGDNDLYVVGEGGLTGAENIFVLAMPSGKPVGFYLWDSTATLNEGKVYLQGTSGTRTYLPFNEVTGISDMNRETMTNNRYFDMQGRRVAQPTKGMYIVNGKKVIMR